jgi:hypothetical protein
MLHALAKLKNVLTVSLRGCGLLSQIHLWHSEMLEALVFISIGYTEFSDKPFDLG